MLVQRFGFDTANVREYVDGLVENYKKYRRIYFDTKRNKEVKRWNKNVEWRERTHNNPYYMEGYNYYYKGN